jgi:FAD:protein FMN transferase
VLSGFVSGFQRPKLLHHRQHFEAVLGTALEVQLETNSHQQTKNAQAALLHEIERLEQIFSRFVANSELNRFLATQDSAFALSPELEFVLLHAIEWQRRSGGAFHLGTEALVQIWENAQTPPSPTELLPTLKALEQPLLELGVGYAVRCTTLPINLHAIAKGYIADCAAQKAARHARNVLVNLGGDLVHRGCEAVTVNIANPHTNADNAPPLERIGIFNQGLATSGHTHRGFRFGQKHFSHLLDPRTGQPVQEVLSASVLAPNAMIADVLATVCSVLHPEQSLELLHEELQIGVCIVTKGKTYRNSFWKHHQRKGVL